MPGAPAGLMSIGEVLAHLRGEFPEVTISKLRFLEAEGLVEPQRTPSGYRKYAWSDVARLRFVLTAQRDHYLPLRVIREQLAALDHSQETGRVAREALSRAEAATRPAAPDGSDATARPVVVGLADHRGADHHGRAGRPDDHALAGRPDDRVLVGLADQYRALLAGPPATSEPAQLRLDRAELLARSGLTEPVLAEVEGLGMIKASGGCYDTDALTVARVVAQLGEYGLGPRHLRGYRAAADREVGLFAQLVAPLAKQRTPAARDRAAEMVRELVALSQQLHAALVRLGLRDTLG